MTRRLLLSPGALDDIKSALAWYEGRRAGLGAKFESALDGSLARIRQSPMSCPVVAADGLRRVMIKGFPYHLYFKANEDAVRVIVVFHTSRDPKSLVQRLQH